MEPSEARKLRQLCEENSKLKRLAADLSLDKAMLHDVLQKSFKTVSQEIDRDVPDGSILDRCSPRMSVCSTAPPGLILP